MDATDNETGNNILDLYLYKKYFRL